MKQTAELGMNRTGISSARDRAEEMKEGLEQFPMTEGATDGVEVARMREDYAKRGESLGTVPPPTGVKGKAKAAAQAVRGAHPTIFMDKLGERLAFERTGVRLYEGLISKHHAYGSFDGGPTEEDLELILGQEREHFELLSDSMEALGADPTAITPSADLQSNAGKGIGDVIADPRTSLLQSLEAILVAELVDNASWESLAELAGTLGENELESRFWDARRIEEEHLVKVKGWIAAGQARAEVAEA